MNGNEGNDNPTLDEALRDATDPNWDGDIGEATARVLAQEVKRLSDELKLYHAYYGPGLAQELAVKYFQTLP